MSDETKTPRTDELARMHRARMASSSNDPADLLRDALDDTESHARTLERESATLREELERVKFGRADLVDHVVKLREELDRVRKERDALQHIIDCANTPLMRDVLAERDAAMARAEAAEKRCEVLRSLTDTAAGEQGLANHRMMQAQAARDNALTQLAAAQEAFKPIYDQLCALKMSHPHWIRLKWLDDLKAFITPQPSDGTISRKEGDEPCAQQADPSMRQTASVLKTQEAESLKSKSQTVQSTDGGASNASAGSPIPPGLAVFDLTAALAGAKVVTRDRRAVKNLHVSMWNGNILIGFVDNEEVNWWLNGRYGDADTPNDLFLAPQPEEPQRSSNDNASCVKSEGVGLPQSSLPKLDLQ